MPEPLDDTPPAEELEMATEELLGRPLAGNPSERIQAIQKRIVYLQDQRRRTENTEEPGRSKLLGRIDADLAEARQQLAEWQKQHQERN